MTTDQADYRGLTNPVSAVVRKIAVTMVVGGSTYLAATPLDEASALILSALLGGVVLVVQFLADFESRLESVEGRIVDVVVLSDRRAEQREEDMRQQQLILVRNVEEQIARVIGETFNLRQREEPLVRELTHSLNTPLAQMEATLLSSAQLGTSGAAADDTVLAGIRICKSFLSAFREVATLARDAEGWQAESLELALRSAAQLYAQQDKLSIKLELDVPGSVAGYDNNYILAVLLPLLENAIEASPADGLVGISLRTDFAAGFQVFDVVNATRLQPVLPTEVYDQQWTSKAGHDGLGLSTVKNLLAGMSSARVTHSVASDGRVRFSVWLPRRLP